MWSSKILCEVTVTIYFSACGLSIVANQYLTWVMCIYPAGIRTKLTDKFFHVVLNGIVQCQYSGMLGVLFVLQVKTRRPRKDNKPLSWKQTFFFSLLCWRTKNISFNYLETTLLLSCSMKVLDHTVQRTTCPYRSTRSLWSLISNIRWWKFQ